MSKRKERFMLIILYNTAFGMYMAKYGFNLFLFMINTTISLIMYDMLESYDMKVMDVIDEIRGKRK